MFTHHLKIAFRNMWKYKTQSLTGIFGLAFGLACFVPALYWLRYETSYDCFYPDAAQIYRIYAVEKQSGKVNEQVPGILEKKLHEHFPAMGASTAFFVDPDNYSAEGTPHIRLRTLYTDSAFFRIFPQTVVCGDARQPLQIMNNIVLTETVAKSMFGDVEKAIGQQIQSNILFFDPPYTVTAVVRDPPPNTNLSFDVILYSDLLNTYAEMPEEVQWTAFNMQLYVKFHPQTDIGEIAKQLRDITSRLETNTGIELQILPVSDVRHKLNADVPFTLNFIRLFILAGILLLFSALFNFLNMHLGIFRQRIRELRQRMVHGATNRQLIVQMIFELAGSLIISLILACSFIVLTRPLFSGLLNITMGMSNLIHLFVVCGTGVVTLILLIGLIPFWRLIRLTMRHLSKRKITGQPALRRMAVTLQLAVSVVFIVAALVVMMQIRFVNCKDLGFDHHNIIQLSGLLPVMERDVRTVLIHELEAIPQIENVTATTYFEPQHSANIYELFNEVEWPGKLLYEKPAFHVLHTDDRFADTYGLKVLIGKWWNEGEQKKIVLNEEAVRIMGLTEPVGAIIRMSAVSDNANMQEYEVVGVVNDFHTLSLRSRIQPTILTQSPSPAYNRYDLDNVLYIRIIPGQEREAIRRITAIIPSIDATMADVRLTPLDELYDSLNRSEQAGLKLFSVLATVCLLISLFGIYAVATAATQRRRKEIAIRKVVGAEVGDIIHMFFREYTLQVILACVVALPFAYYAMHRWLQGYAYRTNIPWWLLTGVITAVIAIVLLTVLGQTLKAANSNPADTVKGV